MYLFFNEDDDLDIIGQGVSKLRDIAVDMTQELDNQNEALEIIDSKAEKALDNMDDMNIRLKNTLDKVINI